MCGKGVLICRWASDAGAARGVLRIVDPSRPSLDQCVRPVSVQSPALEVNSDEQLTQPLIMLAGHSTW